MAQWRRVSRLKVEHQELVKDFYKSKFIPLEVRHYIADWIEQNLIKNPQRPSVENFFGEMAVELMSQVHSVEMGSITTQTINDFIHNLGGYDQNSLLSTFQECLNFEKEIISSSSDDIGNGLETVTEYLAQISQNLNFLRTNQDEMFKRQCSQTIHQTLGLINQEMEKIITNLIDDKIPELRYKQQFLCSFLIRLGDETESKESKKSSKSNANCPSPGHSSSQSPPRSRNNSDQQNSFWISQSNEITDLCEKLCIRFEKTFQVLVAILGELKRALSYGLFTEDFRCIEHKNYLKITWGQLTNLISNSLIVLVQPDFVQKTTKLVKTSVCLLLGRVLNFGRSNSGLKARMTSVLNENQLNEYLLYKSNGTNSPQMIESSGTIERNEEKFIQKDGGLLVAQFNELKIMTIERKLKREGGLRVTDEKYCLLYNTILNVNILGEQLTFPAWTISLPIGVVVGVDQNWKAKPCMLWDYAFREKGRLTLEAPQFGSYFQLFCMLSKWFEIATGAGLKTEHFEYLLTKFSKKIDNNGIQMVSYDEFCKKNLPDRGFTFFDSFYSSLEITSKFLKVPWCKGSILGFYSKAQTETIIKNCPVGHFIVRFSDSILGAITFSFRKQDLTVTSCSPYTSDELSFKDFCEEINHIPELTHVYPNVPKSEGFPVNLNLSRQLGNLHGYEARIRITRISGSDGANTSNTISGASFSSSYYDVSSPANRSQNYQFQNNSVYGLSPNYPNSNYSFSSSISQPPSPNEDPNFFLSLTSTSQNPLSNSTPIEIPNQVLPSNMFDEDFTTHL